MINLHWNKWLVCIQILHQSSSWGSPVKMYSILPRKKWGIAAYDLQQLKEGRKRRERGVPVWPSPLHHPNSACTGSHIDSKERSRPRWSLKAIHRSQIFRNLAWVSIRIDVRFSCSLVPMSHCLTSAKLRNVWRQTLANVCQEDKPHQLPLGFGP